VQRVEESPLYASNMMPPPGVYADVPQFHDPTATCQTDNALVASTVCGKTEGERETERERLAEERERAESAEREGQIAIERERAAAAEREKQI
ncbi:hypothetical protein KIPB_016963, partial [Kipferlia bialata]